MADDLYPDELRQQIEQIDQQIQTIKSELLNLGPMRPGLLTRQYQRPREKKVPYWQLSYTHQQRSHSDYIRDSLYDEILPEVEAYKQFTDLTRQWSDLSVERGQLSLKLLRMTAPRRSRKKKSAKN